AKNEKILRLLLLAGGLVLTARLSAEFLERHQMSSEDNEDHAFDTSSLRHLK
ncbi:hypothetical protein PENNAL_c0592G10369, partial [Penicillium nalgiovense]